MKFQVVKTYTYTATFDVEADDFDKAYELAHMKCGKRNKEDFLYDVFVHKDKVNYGSQPKVKQSKKSK